MFSIHLFVFGFLLVYFETIINVSYLFFVFINSLFLFIRFKFNCQIIVAPVCRPGQKTIYSAGRQEMIKILCELEANPYNVTFNWKFNSSTTEFLDLPASQIFPEKNNAVAQYTPMTEHVSDFIKYFVFSVC